MGYKSSVRVRLQHSAARSASGRCARSALYAPEKQNSRRHFWRRMRLHTVAAPSCKRSIRATKITAPGVGPAQRRTLFVFSLLMFPAGRPSGARGVRRSGYISFSEMARQKKNTPCMEYGHGDAASRTDVSSYMKIQISEAAHKDILYSKNWAPRQLNNRECSHFIRADTVRARLHRPPRAAIYWCTRPCAPHPSRRMHRSFCLPI